MLTEKLNCIKEFNEIAAMLYADKYQFELSIEDISRLRKYTKTYIKYQLKEANWILRNHNDRWMYGLSKGTIKILSNLKYKSFNEFYKDYIDGDMDLERIPAIGHTKARDIISWAHRKKKAPM